MAVHGLFLQPGWSRLFPSLMNDGEEFVRLYYHG